MLTELLCWQIHKQAPPLEDIAGDCSPGMRELIESALERNPNHRPRAADLLKHEALNPPPEDQPRCQSLDSALFERKRLLSRKELELPENIAGRSPCCVHVGVCLCACGATDHPPPVHRNLRYGSRKHVGVGWGLEWGMKARHGGTGL